MNLFDLPSELVASIIRFLPAQDFFHLYTASVALRPFIDSEIDSRLEGLCQELIPLKTQYQKIEKEYNILSLETRQGQAAAVFGVDVSHRASRKAKCIIDLGEIRFKRSIIIEEKHPLKIAKKEISSFDSKLKTWTAKNSRVQNR